MGLGNVGQFQVSLVPGQYRVEMISHVTGSASGDIVIAWNFSGTYSSAVRTALDRAVANPDGTGATTPDGIRVSGHSLETTVNYGVEASTTGIREDILMRVTAAGTLTMQAAQNVANASVTVISAASRIYVTRFRADRIGQRFDQTLEGLRSELVPCSARESVLSTGVNTSVQRR